MILSLLVFCVGLSMLFFGGDILVRACQILSIHLKTKLFFISLLLLGMGTSAPELFVTVQSHISGESHLAAGNIIGSNIFNILIVSALIILSASKIKNKQTVLKSTGWLILATFCALFFILDQELSLWNGLVFLVLFGLCLIAPPSLSEKKRPLKTQTPVKLKSFFHAGGFILLGFILLFSGAQLTIESSLSLGEHLGWSKRIIGLFLISVGTSLPELAIGLIALVKKNSEIALGSIIGSNGFNTFFIPAIASLWAPLPVDRGFLKMDAPIMLASEGVLFLTLLGFKKIPKLIAFLFILSYLLYAYFILFNRI